MKRTALFRTIPTENEGEKYWILEVLDTKKTLQEAQQTQGIFIGPRSPWGRSLGPVVTHSLSESLTLPQ